MTTLIPKFSLKNGSSTPANAVNRPINQKLSDVISVKDFGATGDGTTDDTTAIQSALTYAGTVKCAVYIPATANSYLITNFLTVPDYVTVYGDGYGSYINQTGLNKDGFVIGNFCTVKNVRVKVANGDNSAFVNCVYAIDVDNPTIQDCFLIPGDLGGCGVQVRNCTQTIIKNNRIYGGKWTSGASFAASAADILFYSSGTSQRHLIDGNFCLSNNSQGMFIDALGFDSDIIVSNNTCVTLDPATCVEGGAWSEIATGGVRRHGIVMQYNNDSVGGPRSLIANNICRNTRWTGIYKQATVAYQVTISNNICSNNGYDTTNSLSGGIYITQTGGEIVSGNSILDFKNTNAGAGGITINGYGANEATLISNNVIKNSLGYGINMGILPRKIHITANEFINNAFNDVYFLPTAAVTNVGEIFIENNFFQKNINSYEAIYFDLQAGTLINVVSNNLFFGNDNTSPASNRNAAIRVRQATGLVKFKNKQSIKSDVPSLHQN
jgi:hypothetical protein